MPQDPAESVLRPLKLPDALKASAWDAFHQAKDLDDLSTRLGKLSIPTSVKAQLWDAKSQIAAPVAPPTPETPMVEEPGLMRSAIDAVGDVATGAVKGAANTAIGLGQLAYRVPGVRQASDAVQRAVAGDVQPADALFDQARASVQPTTTAENVGFMGEQMAEFLAPIGLAGKVGGAVRGASKLMKGVRFGVKSAAEAAEMAGRAAVQSSDPEDVVSAALMGSAGPAVSGLLGSVGKVVFEKLPERLYGQVFKLAEDDLRQAYRTAAKGQPLNPTLAREVLDRGLFGSSRNMAVYAFQKLDALEAKLKSELSGKFVKMPKKQEYVALLSSVADEFGGAFSKMGQEAGALRDRITKGIRGPYLSASDALALKRLLDRSRNTSSFRMSPKLSPKQEEYKEAADLARSVLHRSFPSASKILNEERVMIEAADAIVSDATSRTNRKLLGLTDYLLGGGGMASGFGLSGVGAAATVRGFQNPFTLTTIGHYLDAAGKVAPEAQAVTRGASGAVLVGSR
jgi:hypothetical protein